MVFDKLAQGSISPTALLRSSGNYSTLLILEAYLARLGCRWFTRQEAQRIPEQHLWGPQGDGAICTFPLLVQSCSEHQGRDGVCIHLAKELREKLAALCLAFKTRIYIPKIQHTTHLECVSYMNLWHMDSLFSIKFQEFYSWEKAGIMESPGKHQIGQQMSGLPPTVLAGSANFHQVSIPCLQTCNTKFP